MTSVDGHRSFSRNLVKISKQSATCNVDDTDFKVKAIQFLSRNPDWANKPKSNELIFK